MVDKYYYGGSLQLTIKDTLVEETTWFDTTVVTINLIRPPCPVTKSWLTSQEATPVQGLQATQSIETDSFNFLDLNSEIIEIFKLDEETFCGPIDFKFVPEASQPFDFNQDTLEFTLRPELQDPPGTSINYSF